MKIAMMTNNYKPFIGGVPISVERLAKGLRALDMKYVFLLRSMKEKKSRKKMWYVTGRIRENYPMEWYFPVCLIHVSGRNLKCVNLI